MTIQDRPMLAPVSPELIWFTGPDAVRFLNDLISQEVGTAEPGEVRRSLLLSPQGKLDFIFWALRGEDRVGLATDDGRGAELVARLRRYLIRVKVETATAEAPAALVVGDAGPSPGGWAESGESLVADVSWARLARSLVVGRIPDLPRLSDEEYTALRIEAGEPLMEVDVTEATIPQETGLVPETISFTKGCFLGQELVARLDSRGGRVNHHLRILRFAGPAAEVGSVIEKGGESVGELTSAADGIGMAMLRRGVEPGDLVVVGESQAVVEALPGD